MKAITGYLAAAVCTLALLSSAEARGRHVRQHSEPQIDFLSPYDESYGTSPSFQIYPYAYGGPAVRVVEHCQYPDGWNVTDFTRDVNGIPAGVDHACPAPVYGRRARTRE